jgi:hypothetical protein
MTIAAANRRDNPETLFATPEIVADRRADGSIWLKSAAPLQRGARCVGDWLENWARQPLTGFFSANVLMSTRHGRPLPTRTRYGRCARAPPVPSPGGSPHGPV